MSNTPTPRTDAARIPNADLYDEGIGMSNYISADEMAKFERELAEAQEHAKHGWTTADNEQAAKQEAQARLTEALGCLGYSVPSNFLPKFGYKCGLCEAKDRQLADAQAQVENQKYEIAHLQTLLDQQYELVTERTRQLASVRDDVLDTLEMNTLNELQGSYSLVNTTELEQLKLRLSDTAAVASRHDAEVAAKALEEAAYGISEPVVQEWLRRLAAEKRKEAGQ